MAKMSEEKPVRALDLQEKAIDDEGKEREREHERDERDRQESERSDARLERMATRGLLFVAIVFAAIFYKDPAMALKAIGTLVAVVVTLAGGVGIERIRQGRAQRKKLSPPSDDE